MIINSLESSDTPIIYTLRVAYNVAQQEVAQLRTRSAWTDVQRVDFHYDEKMKTDPKGNDDMRLRKVRYIAARLHMKDIPVTSALLCKKMKSSG